MIQFILIFASGFVVGLAGAAVFKAIRRRVRRVRGRKERFYHLHEPHAGGGRGEL